ncbi:hypothetical protein AcW1_009328 [Taiwanofungus camphoratus]|nr:hypothetical protein AcV5_002192 [Antrodia cinnamomea]KAI0944241.1 hypothetical protein AcW1_001996 [Antrodia cinnamomea]KAI0946441.1 hypothetical protein AcW1_009902 [Antrodia cinnamomea]KAI0947615.1 hypothetical protein AcW1_009328 [Antrodia cinnamomea]
MQRLLSDPSEAQCPDYASPRYAATRASCINANTTEAQAIQLLINIWHEANQVDRQQWQNQLDEQAAILENHIHLAEEAETHRREAAKIEEEATRKEELKKNKGKYIPIPDRDAPIITPVLPATYAVRKMEKGLYVEMYYYTNKGLDEAINVTGTIDDEAMVLQQNANGTTAWVPAAATRDAHGVIDDKDLVWEDFCQAVPRMILAMEQAGWLAERVLMVATFWGNLQIHPMRSSRDPLDQKTLLLYQAEQRKLWHMAIPSAQGAWNLSRISEEILEKTRARVYWEDRRQKDNQRDLYVHNIHMP